MKYNWTNDREKERTKGNQSRVWSVLEYVPIPNQMLLAASKKDMKKEIV